MLGSVAVGTSCSLAWLYAWYETEYICVWLWLEANRVFALSLAVSFKPARLDNEAVRRPADADCLQLQVLYLSRRFQKARNPP